MNIPFFLQVMVFWENPREESTSVETQQPWYFATNFFHPLLPFPPDFCRFVIFFVGWKFPPLYPQAGSLHPAQGSQTQQIAVLQ